METNVKASTNWTLSGGQDITRTIKTNVTHEDVFIKPSLDEILSDDGAILLIHPEHQSENIFCEFQIRVFPRFKIESLSMVCTTAKAELFTGQQKEYNETLYGSAIEEDDNNVGPDQTMNIGSYRYDIEVSKSGITEIMLKLLTNAREICIFGIVLNIAPNPNGITTLLPNTINLDNVEQMLNSSNSKLSPNAEKCKMFMQMYKSTCRPKAAPTSQNEEHYNKFMEMMSNKSMSASSEASDQVNMKLNSVDILNDIKAYVNTRLDAFETKLLAQLTAYEASQSSKLDKILMYLESKP